MARRLHGKRVKALLFAVVFALTLGGFVQAAMAAYPTVARSYYGPGSGNYASKTKIADGDVNGDGYDDVIQLYYRTTSTSSAYLFRSGGTSMARIYQRYFSMEFSKTQIAAGDYNGDGYDDLYLLHDRGGSTCSVYLMTSNGSVLGAPTEIYRTGTGGMAFSRARLTAADVNKDGMDEAVVFYESSAGKARVYVIGKNYAQVKGRVVSASSGEAVAGVYVVLRNSSDVQIASTTTGADGSYTLSTPVGSGYRATFAASDYLSATYWGISASASGATSLETVKLVPAGSSGLGAASGIISNAFDGTGVPDLAVTLRSGLNNVDGSLAGYSTTTDAGGAFSFASLPGGVYTGQVSGSGFLTTYFTIVSIGGQTIANQNMAITPILTGNDMRIVLTWGATPNDLDSHLTGPPTSGTTRFHVYYSAKRYPSSGDPVIAILDHDDTVQYGPETITLSKTSGGVYRYSVYDYSNSGSTSSTALGASGAQVRVYQGSSLIRTFNVPNAAGTLWKVFEVSGSTITSFNTMSYGTNSGAVQ